MKNKWIRIGLILLVGLIAGVYTVYGQDSGFEFGYDTPVSGVVGFRIPTGHYCLTDARDGNAYTTCYCPCEQTCGEITPEPTDTPEPTPEPTDKPKCNSGRGNDSEGDPDCDPGNSGGHNQGGD